MNIWITTCSKIKSGGGKPYDAWGWHEAHREELIKKRVNVLDLLQKKQLVSDLTLPAKGPDFGGDAVNRDYLPAFKRYREGSFVRGFAASGRKMSAWIKENRLFFISGLYGLAHHNQPIQNYDLDIRQRGLLKIWKLGDVLTKTLDSYLKNLGPCNIIDCCLNPDYSSLIDWKELARRVHTVRHAVPGGSFDPGQIRYTCGKLAGEPAERIYDLIGHPMVQYTSENGIVFFENKAGSQSEYGLGQEMIRVPQSERVSAPEVGRKPKLRVASGPLTEKANIAVAYFEENQKEAMFRHARKNGWDDLARLEFITNLRRETIENLNKFGTRLLIVHVDQTHSTLHELYKTRSNDILRDVPNGWSVRKVRHREYAAIRLASRVDFS